MLLEDYFWPNADVATGFMEVNSTDGLITLVMPGDPQKNESGFYVIEPNCWILLEELEEGYELLDVAPDLSRFGAVRYPMITVQGWTRNHIEERLHELGIALLPTE